MLVILVVFVTTTAETLRHPSESKFLNLVVVFFYIIYTYSWNANMFLPSNSAYSSSFCSHSLMLTEWGCDSICVGCKTGMIVELDICVFSDASLEEDYTSPSSSKDDTTYHHSHTHACHFVCRKNGFPQRWNHY